MRIDWLPLAAMSAMTALTLGACGSSRPAAQASAPPQQPAEAVEEVTVAPANVGLNGGVAAMPKAHIFRVNGDVRPDVNVAVTLSPDRSTLVSFPAPSDLTTPMAIRLKEGYWLDLRGISAGSQYLSLTIDEYRALTPEQLTPAFLMSKLVDAAWPVEIVALPFSPSAPDRVSRADSLISEGLPDCKIVYARPFGRPIR